MGISTKVKTLIAMWSLEAPYCYKASWVWSVPTTSTKTTGARTTNKRKSSYSVIKALLYGRLSGGNNSWSTGVLHWLKLVYAYANACQCRVTLTKTCVQLTFFSFFQACAFYALGCYGRPRCPPALTNRGRAAGMHQLQHIQSTAETVE